MMGEWRKNEMDVTTTTGQIFEATWEELTQQADRLAGKRLRVEVLDNGHPAPNFGEHPLESAQGPRNLAEFLGDYVGAVQGTGEALSELTGERFTEYLEHKRREGRL
jgi:hypothetical protein